MDKEAFEGGRDTSASDIPANVSRRADPAGARTCSADPPRQQLAATTPRTAIGPAPKKEKRGRANCSADAAPPPLPPLQRARARTRSLSPPPPFFFTGPQALPASSSPIAGRIGNLRLELSTQKRWREKRAAHRRNRQRAAPKVHE